ncbi:Disease resistance protein TAO1, partial [Ananas comosus]
MRICSGDQCSMLKDHPSATSRQSSLSGLTDRIGHQQLIGYVCPDRTVVTQPNSKHKITPLHNYRRIIVRTRVPGSVKFDIGSLQNLQILNLMLCESLKELPESIGDLSNLLTLNLSSCKSLFSLPSSTGNLRSLQHLDLSFSGVQKLPETVCHLSNLRSINLWCCHALDELIDKLPVSMKSMTTQPYIIMDGGCRDLTTMPSRVECCAAVFEDYGLLRLLRSSYSGSSKDLKLEDQL